MPGTDVIHACYFDRLACDDDAPGKRPVEVVDDDLVDDALHDR